MNVFIQHSNYVTFCVEILITESQEKLHCLGIKTRIFHEFVLLTSAKAFTNKS